MADVEFRIDKKKLERLAYSSEQTRSMVEQKTHNVQSTAAMLSAGFRTGLYYRDHKTPAVGGTEPYWKANVKKYGVKPVGIVVTGNYAAMKDNHLHNTLLKSL